MLVVDFPHIFFDNLSKLQHFYMYMMWQLKFRRSISYNYLRLLRDHLSWRIDRLTTQFVKVNVVWVKFEPFYLFFNFLTNILQLVAGFTTRVDLDKTLMEFISKPHSFYHYYAYNSHLWGMCWRYSIAEFVDIDAKIIRNCKLRLFDVNISIWLELLDASLRWMRCWCDSWSLFLTETSLYLKRWSDSLLGLQIAKDTFLFTVALWLNGPCLLIWRRSYASLRKPLPIYRSLLFSSSVDENEPVAWALWFWSIHL